MKAVYEEVRKYAFHGRNCIFFGPSGTGKEYLARFYFEEFTQNAGNGDNQRFQTVNCAGLNKELAHSALFGHVKGAFTTAVREKPGAFEEADNGVLFLDEAGDLDPEIQATMNRALDPDVGEAHRLGSERKYPTVNVTVIAATERLKDAIRPSLLSRFGAQVMIPGIDERPEDLTPAIAFFAIRSLAKRRDIQTLCRNFFRTDVNPEIDILVSDANLLALAEDLSAILTPIAAQRSWECNFRTLRITVDTAIILPELDADRASFISETKTNFIKHLETYSQPLTISSSPVAQDRLKDEDVPLPPYLAGDLIKALNGALPTLSELERDRWVRFLMHTEDGDFRSRDALKVHPNLTLRTIQNRLGRLVKEKLLFRNGGRGDIYRLALPCNRNTVEAALPIQEFLPLPERCAWPEHYPKNRETLLNILANAKGIYISGDSGETRTACAAALGHELSVSQPVCYWDFGQQDILALFQTIAQELENRKISTAPVLQYSHNENPAFDAALLSGYIPSLFGVDSHPVLILDHVDRISRTQARQGLLNMVRHWHNITFVLLGRKMGNDLQVEVPRALYEYRLETHDGRI
jgi:hypothetical protein